jgi:hypothetical protein
VLNGAMILRRKTSAKCFFAFAALSLENAVAWKPFHSMESDAREKWANRFVFVSTYIRSFQLVTLKTCFQQVLKFDLSASLS